PAVGRAGCGARLRVPAYRACGRPAGTAPSPGSRSPIPASRSPGAATRAGRAAARCRADRLTRLPLGLVGDGEEVAAAVMRPEEAGDEHLRPVRADRDRVARVVPLRALVLPRP